MLTNELLIALIGAGSALGVAWIANRVKKNAESNKSPQEVLFDGFKLVQEQKDATIKDLNVTITTLRNNSKSLEDQILSLQNQLNSQNEVIDLLEDKVKDYDRKLQIQIEQNMLLKQENERLKQGASPALS